MTIKHDYEITISNLMKMLKTYTEQETLDLETIKKIADILVTLTFIQKEITEVISDAEFLALMAKADLLSQSIKDGKSRK